MQKIFLFFILFVAANAAPAEEVKILKYDNINDGLGSYSYNVETSDGVQKQEEGVFVKSNNPEEGSMKVTGFFTYTGPDGVQYTVKYTADENGFRPEGAHLPKAPEEQARLKNVGQTKAPRLDVRFN